MAVHLHTFKDAETRVKTSLVSALNSALIIYLSLLIVVVLGIVFARR